MTHEQPLHRAVRFAVGDDGTVIWSSYTVDADDPMCRQAAVAPREVQAALTRLPEKRMFDLGVEQESSQLNRNRTISWTTACSKLVSTRLV